MNTNNQDIDLMIFINFIKNKFKIITIFIVISFIASVVISYLIPNKYTSVVTYFPYSPEVLDSRILINNNNVKTLNTKMLKNQKGYCVPIKFYLKLLLL